MELNTFIIAFKKKELEEYLLGKGEYFFSGDEYSGGYERHDGRVTHGYVFNAAYSNEMPEKKAYMIVEREYIRLMKKYHSAKIAFDASMLIWRYLYDVVERHYMKGEWKFSDEFLTELLHQYRYFLKHKTGDAQLDHLMKVRKELLRSRFGFEVC